MLSQHIGLIQNYFLGFHESGGQVLLSRVHGFQFYKTTVKLSQVAFLSGVCGPLEVVSKTNQSKKNTQLWM